MMSIVNRSQQADFGMPVFGRVRVTSLRTLPWTMGSASASGRKCALVDPARKADGYRLGTDVAVITGAFPGTSAWSPPI